MPLSSSDCGEATSRCSTSDAGLGFSRFMLLDLLHYFREEEQSRILASAAATANTVIIRDAIRDGSLRYRLTYLQEVFSRVIRWLRADRLHFLMRDDVIRPFGGFQVEILPLFGRTPFNNYLFVFRRSTDGMTKE